jgi:hypothetical protein
MAMKIGTPVRALIRLVRGTDPADLLLFAGLGSLTLAAGLLHVGVALIVFGLGAFYLGLMAGRTPPKADS